MSLCINPPCPQPAHPENSLNRYCQGCGSDLLLQGRYRVMRLISSQSGFGKVYEAYERNIPKILKVLKDSHTLNAKVLELFQREALVLSRLNHPGVPQVDVDGYFVYRPEGAAQPLHCIVMEKIDGPNLKQWMVQQGNHTISEPQALLWLTQLTDVLHLVHQQNYFHRDIKPENIMLRSSGQLVLVDFGAAREMTDTYLAHLGASGITTVSSAGYTPPEQEQGQAVPQSDFYALGRTIIYLLTAKAPNDPSIYDSRTNALNWRIYAPQISPGLARLIDDLIAPRAVDRPQTTQEILQRLAAVRSAQTQPPPLVAESVTVPETPSYPTTTMGNGAPIDKPRSQPTSRRSGRWAWAAIAVLGLLIGVPAVWWAEMRSRATPPADQQDAPVQTVSPVKILTGHNGPIRTLLRLGNNTLISGSEDRTIRIWNLKDGTTTQVLEGHTSVVVTLALSTDQQTLYSAGSDQAILIWDLPSGQLKQTVPSAHASPINTLALSPDGRILASGSADGVVKLWDAETGALLEQLAAPGDLVNDLRFNHSGDSLIAGGETIQVWNLRTQEEKTFDTGQNLVNRLAVSPNNQVLISADVDKTVRFWDLATGNLLNTTPEHSRAVNDVFVSLNSLTFVTASADGTLAVWDMESLQPTARLQGFDSDLWRYVEGSAGQLITTGGTDNTIKIWQK